MPEVDYQIRPARDDDLPQILNLLDLGLGSAASKQRTEAFWKWKHVNQPFGPSIVFVAELNGRIIGLRAFMRWGFSNIDAEGCKQNWHAVRAVDTVTHPDFRRMGIFRQLNEVAIEAARNEGVDFIFNTPNAQSRAGYLKQGWKEVGILRLFFRFNRVKDVLRAGIYFIQKKGREAGNQWTPQTLKLISQNDHTFFDDLFEEFKDYNNQLATTYSPEYFYWRYASHPFVNYYQFSSGDSTDHLILRPNFRFGIRELVVCEMTGKNTTDTDYRRIRKALAQNGSSYYVGHSSDSHPNREKIRKMGLVKAPSNVGMLLVFYPLSERAAKENLLSLDRWALTLGTLEVF